MTTTYEACLECDHREGDQADGLCYPCSKDLKLMTKGVRKLEEPDQRRIFHAWRSHDAKNRPQADGYLAGYLAVKAMGLHTNYGEQKDLAMGMLDAFLGEHRFLQGEIVGTLKIFLTKWVERANENPDRHLDDRNRYAYDWVKKLVNND